MAVEALLRLRAFLRFSPAPELPAGGPASRSDRARIEVRGLLRLLHMLRFAPPSPVMVMIGARVCLLLLHLLRRLLARDHEECRARNPRHAHQLQACAAANPSVAALEKADAALSGSPYREHPEPAGFQRAIRRRFRSPIQEGNATYGFPMANKLAKSEAYKPVLFRRSHEVRRKRAKRERIAPSAASPGSQLPARNGPVPGHFRALPACRRTFT